MVIMHIKFCGFNFCKFKISDNKKNNFAKRDTSFFNHYFVCEMLITDYLCTFAKYYTDL